MNTQSNENQLSLESKLIKRWFSKRRISHNRLAHRRALYHWFSKGSLCDLGLEQSPHNNVRTRVIPSLNVQFRTISMLRFLEDAESVWIASRSAAAQVDRGEEELHAENVGLAKTPSYQLEVGCEPAEGNENCVKLPNNSGVLLAH